MIKLHITTIEPSNIFQLLSPIILTLISTILTIILPIIIVRYYSLRDKNQYIKLLKINFPLIKTLKFKIIDYKIVNIFGLLCYFALGIVFGLLIGVYTGNILIRVINFILPNFDNNINAIMILGLLLHISLVFIIVFMTYWFKLFNAKFQMLKRANISSISLFSYHHSFFLWTYTGLIIGANVIIYLFLYSILYTILLSKQVTFSFTLTFLEGAYTAISSRIPYLGIYGSLYLVCLLMSLSLLFVIWYEINSNSEKAIESICNLYKCDFPYVKIKTDSGEVKGQLRDIYNKSLVTLSEDGLLKIVPLDKIEIMEVRHPKKDEYIVFDNNFIKK